MKFKYFYVKEASLSKAELIKPVNGYSNRGELLLTKLMDGSPFELTGGLSSKLTVSDEELELIRDMVRTNDFTEIGNVKFKTDTGMLIPLGKIEKTLEFGSNKGSGGGSGQTKLVESVTAVVTAYYINKKIKNVNRLIEFFKNETEEVIINELQSVSSHYSIDSKLEDNVAILKNNPSWIQSVCWTAVAIKTELKVTPKHSFHYSSKEVDMIKKRAKILKNEIGYGSSNINKWNPSDIWMIKSGSKKIAELMACDTITEFNSLLSEFYISGQDVVGISLKKVGNSYPPVNTYNIGIDKNADINLNKIKPNFMTKKVAITKDILLFGNDNKIKIQIRDFTATAGGKVQGEVSGNLAKAGKVGHKFMLQWMEKHIPNFKGITIYNLESIISKGDISLKFINVMFKIIQQLKKKDEVDTTNINKIKQVENLIALIDKMKETMTIEAVAQSLSSKIQALQFALYTNDDFLEFAYSYATSTVKGMSGPFIKIGN